MAAACARHDSGFGLVGPGSPPRFETRSEIPTGLTVHSDFAVGDFTNDDNVDMVVISYTGDLQVMVGQGSVFTPGQNIHLGGLAFWIDQGDFDGDGDRDVAVLLKDGFAVQVLYNDGNANFTVGPAYPVGPGSLQVLAADANDDGILDLMVARVQSPEIIVFQGAGDGTFTTGNSITLPGGGQSFTMAVGDVTDDSIKDLVVADPQLDRVLVYRGRSPEADFVASPTILSVSGAPGWCSIGDLNGDGHNDIAVSAFLGNRFEVITSFLPVAGPTGHGAVSIAVDGHPSVTTIGDVTGDNLADLVGCVVDRPAIAVVPHFGGGGAGLLPANPQAEVFDATDLPSRPVVVDVDHNGRNDLLALSGFGDRINLWLARSFGALAGARSYASGLTGGGLTVAADLDRDGFVEVVTGSAQDTRLAIMRTRPNIAGTRLVADTTVDVGAIVHQVRAADLDLDGREDLIVTVPTGVKIVRNLSTAGALSFAVLPGISGAFGSGVQPFGATAVDLDRDGRLDLAIADFATGNLQVIRGGASPFDFSAAPQLVPLAGNPVDVVAGDFTGDGILDLAVSRNAQSDVVLLQNDGRGNLSLLVNLPVGAAPNWLLTTDFDRDGRADIVVANGEGNTVTVLFGGASGFLSRSYAAGSYPNALAVGDLTGDGLPDVLVASRLGQDFRVLVNDGQGGFGNAFPFPGRLSAWSVALSDLDRDGDLDLVIGNLSDNGVSVVTNLLLSPVLQG